MARHRRSGRSYGQIRAYMDDITDRHTRKMLLKANILKPKRLTESSRRKERLQMLEEKGLLSLLEKGIPCPVLLPANRNGIATGITAEGFVIIQDWKDPFHPKAIHTKPPRA